MGGGTPFVLRKRGAGASGEYEYSGDAYVHGVMDGEAIKTHQAAGMKFEVLSLV